MLTIGIVCSVLILMVVTWGVVGSCSGCMTRPGPDPVLESIGLARVSARSLGVRLSRAPNQGVKLARFHALRRAGLGTDSLLWADASMGGRLGWRDSSGRGHVMSRADHVAIQTYKGIPWAG